MPTAYALNIPGEQVKFSAICALDTACSASRRLRILCQNAIKSRWVDDNSLDVQTRAAAVRISAHARAIELKFVKRKWTDGQVPPNPRPLPPVKRGRGEGNSAG